LCQDLYSLSPALTSNLHELLETVKHYSNQTLAPAAGAAANKQLLPELAGVLGQKVAS
jgi:hypothetical protein